MAGVARGARFGPASIGPIGRVRRRLGFLVSRWRYRRLLKDRPDLELRRLRRRWNVCTLNTSLSTADVMRANLNLVADVADPDEIPYFWVNNLSERRYRIGVGEEDREQLARSLVQRYRDQAVYVRTDRDGRADEFLLGAPRALEAMIAADTWCVCRKYITPGSTFVMGTLHGCDVEFWREVDGRYETTTRNKISSSMPLDQVRPSKVRIEGRSYPSLVPFTAHPHFEDITFPVDMVYTWVDGDDPVWLEKKNRYLGARGERDLNPEATNESRYLNREELRFSLRSVSMFATFVRRIFIVTDAQVPDWLDTDHPKIAVVDHREIFDDARKLPTFNSHAIESQLHHIDGLAEHYIYMNDDVFLGRHVAASQFFLSNGNTRFFLSKHQIDPGPAVAEDPPVMSAAKNGRDLLLDKFGSVVTQKQQHIPHPQRRSILYEIEREFSKYVEQTSRSRFRSVTDISTASSFHHYYAYLTGRAVKSWLRYSYINTADDDLEERLDGINRRRIYDAFCLNDTDASAVDIERSFPVIRAFLETYFAIPSEFERDVRDAPT